MTSLVKAVAVSAAWCLVLITVVRTAGAADAQRRCEVVWTVEDLPLRDRELLYGVCRMPDKVAERLFREAQTKRTDAAGGDARSQQDKELENAIRRLVAARSYSAALFAQLLPPRSNAAPDKAVPLGAAMQELFKDRKNCLKSPGRGAPTTLEESVERNVREPWLSLQVRSALDPGPCWDAFVANHSVPGWEGDPALVAIYGLPKDRVMLAVGGASPRVEWLPPGYLVRGRAVQFALVPRAVPISVAVLRPGSTHPLIWGFPVTGDQAILADPEQIGCIDLQIAAEAGVRAYVDGVPLDIQFGDDGLAVTMPFYVQVRTHRLTVLADTNHGPPAIRLDVDIPADKLTPHACHRIRHDLTIKNWKAAIGLLDVEADRECVRAGVDGPRLRLSVVDFLSRRGLLVRDLEAWESSVRGISELRAAISTLGGAAVGADRGRVDTVNLLATGAHELLRQGFAKIVWLELYCTQRGPTADYEYSMAARQIDLEKLASRPRDHVVGVGLEEVVSSHVELVEKQDGLQRGVVATMARLIGSPYVRFQTSSSSEEVKFHDTAEVTVETWGGSNVPDENLELVLSRMDLSSEQARAKCGHASRIGRLRALTMPDGEGREEWQVVAHTSVERSAEPQAVRMMAPPSRYGYLLLRSSLHRREGRDLGPELATDTTCVFVRKPAADTWFKVGFAIDAPFLPNRWVGIDPARPEAFSGALTMAGVTWRNVPLGVSLGYLHATRSGETPPNWNDIPGGYDAAGRLPYTVIENTLMLGLPMGGELRVCEVFKLCDGAWRRFGLVGRVVPHLALAFIDQSKVDASLRTFRTSGASDLARELDLGILGHGGTRTQISDTLSLDFLVDVGVPRLWGTSCWNFSNQCRTRATFDRRLIAGLSLALVIGI